MALTDEFAEVLEELEDPSLVPATFTLSGGSAVPCFASGATKGGKLEEFGFASYVDVVVIVRAALFGTAPVRGNTFTCNGIEYLIDVVLTAPGTSFLRIAGVLPSRGV